MIEDFAKYREITGNAQIAYYVRAALSLGLEFKMVTPGYAVEITDPRSRKHWFIIKSILPVNSITSAMLSRNKFLASKILAEHGVAVAPQKELDNEKDAVEFFASHGEIVIKPKRNIGGKSVSILPSSAQEVVSAFDDAYKNDMSGSPVKVIGEKFIGGVNYRLLVAGDEVVGAVMRKPAAVVGDGSSTISELIRMQSSKNKVAGRSEIRVDEQDELRLRIDGLDLGSVLPNGQEQFVRFNSNLTTGGSTVECLSDVHPDYLRMAVDASKALALQVAGVDLITPDITVFSHQAVINEVNHNPGLRLHYNVDEGEVVDVARRVMEVILRGGLVTS